MNFQCLFLKVKQWFYFMYLYGKCKKYFTWSGGYLDSMVCYCDYGNHIVVFREEKIFNIYYIEKQSI